MGDMCVSLSQVKPAAKILDKNGDGKICKLELEDDPKNPKISDADFEAFVNTVRIAPEVEKVPMTKLPEMIALSDKLSIMKGELTVSQFKQFVDQTGYKIEGHNADELRSYLKGAKAGDSLIYVNLLDARAYAKWLSDKTGREFRVQTEAEWLQAKDKLSGNNWTWTETKYNGDSFILRLLDDDGRDGVFLNNDGRDGDFLVHRYADSAVRLVEDR